MSYDDLETQTLTGVADNYSNTVEAPKPGFRAFAETVTTGMQQLIDNDVTLMANTHIVSVPAICGRSFGLTDWQPGTFDSYMDGMRQFDVSQMGKDMVVGIQGLPAKGRIVGYEVLLKGAYEGLEPHEIMPEHPIWTQLIRYSYADGAVVVTSTDESGLQTVEGYDALHRQLVNSNHLIDLGDDGGIGTGYPAHYQFYVHGEYGTGASAGATVYSFRIRISPV